MEKTFFNERNRSILLSACDGVSPNDIAVKMAISRSRVDDILNRCFRVFRNRIHMVQAYHGNSEKYNLINILFIQHDIPSYKYFHAFSWLHKFLIDCYFNETSSNSYRQLYDFLKAVQEIELLKVTDEWIKITREVLWGKSIKLVAKNLGISAYEVSRYVHLSCHTLNKDYKDNFYGDDYEYSIKSLMEHKRIFFDPIDIDLINKKYTCLINCLKDGEEPQPISVPYMQKLFGQTYPDITIDFYINDEIKIGDTKVHRYLGTAPTNESKLLATFGAGPQKHFCSHPDYRYVVVGVNRSDLPVFNDFNNHLWIELFFKIINLLSTQPCVEEDSEVHAMFL